MSLSSIRKKGYLYKLPVKGLVKKWSKRWFVLFATTHEGVVRIEYYDNESCEATQIGKRTIPLRDSIGLAQIPGNKTQPYMFEITSQIGHHIFAADTHSDLQEWIQTIKEAVREDRMKMRRKKTQSLVENTPSAYDQEEEGRYDSSAVSSSGTYRVTLEENETSQRLNLSGAYNLEINPNTITLIAAHSGATMAVWQYKHIRTYGKASGRFNFEIGNTAPTGKGSFIFITTCSKEIFGVVHRNIKRLRKEKERAIAERTQKELAMLKRQMSETTESDRHFQEVAMLRKQRSASAAPSQHSHSAARDTRSRPQTNHSSQENPGGGVVGTYRRSTELEEGHVYDAVAPDQFDPSHLYTEVRKPKKTASSNPQASGENSTAGHVYDQVAPDEFDPSHLYTEVRKPKKTASSNPQASGRSDDSGVDFATPPTSPLSTDPFAKFEEPEPPKVTASSSMAAAVARLSYDSSRDSRDSTFIDQFDDGSFTNPLSIEEELSPLTSGVENPLGDMSGRGAMGDFNIDEFDDKLFETLDEMELQDKLPEMQSEPIQRNTTGEVPVLPPPPQFKAAGPAASRPRGKQPERRLSQKEFDTIWDNICSTLPDSDNYQ